MFVKFKVLRFKNILSYGNKMTVFNFQQGLNLLTGKNAQGKSTIIDALSYALYGQPFRKVKLKELINRRNESGLYTEIEFSINKKEYKIVRSLAPNKFIIYQDGEKLDLLSSKKLTQGELDKIIGINYNLFKQIISLAINYNKPFLSLATRDKRDIVESIFNIKIFGEMLKVLKRNNTGIKLQTEIHKSTITMLEDTIKNIRKQIKSMKVTKRDFDKNKERDLKNINKKIKSFCKEIENISVKLGKDKTHSEKVFVPEELIQDTRKLIEDINGEISKNEYIITRAKKDIKILNVNDNCPICKKDIELEHKEKELKNLAERIDNTNTILETFNTEKNKEAVKLEKLRSKQAEYRKYINDIHTNEEKINFIASQRVLEESQLEMVEERTLSINIEEMETMLEKKAGEYKKMYKEYKSFLKILKNNDISAKILSESGIKSYFFKKLIPILNKNINEYLNKFELPLYMTFDDYMDETIINLGSGNVPVNYYSLSEGEKKRVDMAILFSFIQLTKLISNWNCNLIIMDELLDSSIDDAGLDKMIANLKSMVFSSKEQFCIYIISHRMLESEQFDNIFEIEKSGNFSQINQIKS